jgi:hypothetical protein
MSKLSTSQKVVAMTAGVAILTVIAWYGGLNKAIGLIGSTDQPSPSPAETPTDIPAM